MAARSSSRPLTSSGWAHTVLPVQPSEDIELLVVAKAYPTVNSRYGEALCVAGIRLDVEPHCWVRLSPICLRDLSEHQQFGEFQIIHLRAQRDSGDPRPETMRPEMNSIELGPVLSSQEGWAERCALLQPLESESMCALRRESRRTGASLGLVRPSRVRRVVVEPEREWTPQPRDELVQGNVLVAPKHALIKPRDSFALRYDCADPLCGGHEQKIVDWKLGEAYRKWPDRGPELVRHIEHRCLDDVSGDVRNLLFVVGNQVAHPDGFLVLGTLWPPRAGSPTAEALSLF